MSPLLVTVKTQTNHSCERFHTCHSTSRERASRKTRPRAHIPPPSHMPGPMPVTAAPAVPRHMSSGNEQIRTAEKMVRGSSQHASTRRVTCTAEQRCRTTMPSSNPQQRVSGEHGGGEHTHGRGDQPACDPTAGRSCPAELRMRKRKSGHTACVTANRQRAGHQARARGACQRAVHIDSSRAAQLCRRVLQCRITAFKGSASRQPQPAPY